MVSNSDLEIGGYFLLCYLLIVLLPPTVYFTVEFYQFRRHPVVFNRQFQLSLSYQISLIIYIIGQSWSLFAIVVLRSREQWSYNTLRGVPNVLLLAIALRFWIVYFEINHAVITESGVWIQHVAPDQDQDKAMNFFVKYYGTLGNSNWVLWRIFMPASIVMVIAANLPIVFSGPFLTILIVVLTLFCAVIRVKTPTVKDVWLIKREFRYIVYSFCLMFIAGVVVLSLFLTRSADFRLLRVVEWPVFCTFLAFMSLASNYWVLHKSGLVDVTRYKAQVKTGDFSHSNKPTANSNAAVADMGILDVLQTKDGFYAFMSHCISEYSPENLLFLLEAHQFQQKYGAEDPPKFNMPEEMPISQIVHEEKANLSVLQRFERMMAKYFVRGAPFELNLGHNVVTAMMDTCDEVATDATSTEKEIGEKLSNALNAPISGVLAIAQDNFERFKQTTACLNLVVATQ